MKPRVILIEGYDETRYLAKSLIGNGYKVTAINEDIEKCKLLAGISNLRVFHGDGSKPFVLDDADVYDADIAVAMSPFDDANLVICELCKKKFNIKKTVAVVSDPKKTDFFRTMGIDSVVCAISAISNIIEQHILLSDIKTVMPIGEGHAEVIQISVPENAKVTGQKLCDIDLPKQAIIGCVLRGSRTLVPHGQTTLESGDGLILIVAGPNKEAAIRKLTAK
ncbi:MAG: NAD-binding protein [Clostridia bacterium]|nr:NAD-binding protein [Clostridia bacterium]